MSQSLVWYVGISMMLLTKIKCDRDRYDKKNKFLKRGIPPINENEIKLLFPSILKLKFLQFL